VVPGIDKMPDPPEYHFYHYSVGETKAGPVLFKPVPFEKLEPTMVDKVGWI
jgi:hypothetical protein